MGSREELLLSEVSFSSSELNGLDQPVEIFAVDLDALWGRYWQGQGLEEEPPLPCNVSELIRLDCVRLVG